MLIYFSLLGGGMDGWMRRAGREVKWPVDAGRSPMPTRWNAGSVAVGVRPSSGMRGAGCGAGDGPFHSPSLLDRPAIKQGLVGVATFTGQCTVCAAAAAAERAGENGNKPVYDRQFSAISLSSPSYVLHTFAGGFGLD